MLSLNDRFDLLEADLLADPPRFVMSRDLPFAIFRYDVTHPDEQEWLVRKKIDLLAARVSHPARGEVHSISLAALFWRSVQESEGVSALVELERAHGFEAAERQVNTYLSDPDFRPLCDLLVEEASALPKTTSVIFLTHGTAFAPGAYRVSSLLEQLSRRLTTPSVLFYPGTWQGSLNYLDLRTDDQALGSYRVKIYGRDS